MSQLMHVARSVRSPCVLFVVMVMFIPAEYETVTVLDRDTRSCFDDLVMTWLNLTTYMFATQAIRTGDASIGPSVPFQVNCRTSSTVYCVYPFDILSSVAEAQWPKTLRIFKNVKFDRVEATGEISGDSHLRLVEHIVAGSFVRYYESRIRAIRETFGSDTADWPDPWGFAWMLRNAWAHDGLISFRNQNHVPVSWRSVSVGPDNAGVSPILDRLIGVGDIIALYLELDEAAAAG